MLLEFKAKNYKTFCDELVFSMIPAPKLKGLDYSILKKKINKKEYKALSSAVIYGANASGKTNIIGAMDTFKNIVLRGNIKQHDHHSGPNVASSKLELIPNISYDVQQPVFFSLKFIADDLLIKYSTSLDLGRFLDTNFNHRILSEELKINGELVFRRSESLILGSLKGINQYFTSAYQDNAETIAKLAESSLDDKELFLTNGFKTMFSAALVSIISDWFENKFIIIYGANLAGSVPEIEAQQKTAFYAPKTLNDAVKQIGGNSNLIGYLVDKNEAEPRLCTVFHRDGTKHSTAMSSELFESYGTIHFVKYFPLLNIALKKGATLVIDEFDASIHPMALMSIVNVFHNDDININRAQLIFNTHNPIFLNKNIFRRDEIKFVERTDGSYASTHYSLSDFGTSGESGVRKGDDYMNNYFVERYGAIRNIDLAPIFQSEIKGEEGAL